MMIPMFDVTSATLNAIFWLSGVMFGIAVGERYHRDTIAQIVKDFHVLYSELKREKKQ